jgi:hypothetical protein
MDNNTRTLAAKLAAEIPDLSAKYTDDQLEAIFDCLAKGAEEDSGGWWSDVTEDGAISFEVRVKPAKNGRHALKDPETNRFLGNIAHTLLVNLFLRNCEQTEGWQEILPRILKGEKDPFITPLEETKEGKEAKIPKKQYQTVSGLTLDEEWEVYLKEAGGDVGKAWRKRIRDYEAAYKSGKLEDPDKYDGDISEPETEEKRARNSPKST